MRQSREECHAGICSLIRILIRILAPIKIFQYVRLQFIWGIIHTRRLSSHYLMRTKKKIISPITIQYETLSHMICTEFPKHAVNVTAVSEYCIFTARKRTLGQDNVFTPVCNSVHKGGGVSAPLHTGIHTSTRQVLP